MDNIQKSPLLQRMCERCIEREKNLPECSSRRFYCDFYICSEQPKKRKQNMDVSDDKIAAEVDKLVRKGNTRNTSMIMVASRFELGMSVIRSRYNRHQAAGKKRRAASSSGPKKAKTAKSKPTARNTIRKTAVKKQTTAKNRTTVKARKRTGAAA